MDEIKLAVQVRKEKGRRFVKKMRQGDSIPGVVYGGKAKKPTNIAINRKSYEKIMRHHQGQSVLFHIDVLEGEKKLRDYAAIVKEEQYHPLKETLLHIDFLRVSLKEEIEVDIPINIKGEAIGVKRDSGSIDQPLYEIQILCLPTDIPEHIEVDVSELEIGDALHISDLVLPAGTKTKMDPEQVVVTVVPPMKEEEDEESSEDAEPEVIGEKEKEDGDAKAEGEETESADKK